MVAVIRDITERTYAEEQIKHLAYHDALTNLPNRLLFKDRLTVAIGANNWTNNYPDAVGIFNAATGAGQYPGTSPIGFTGGSYYARVQWDF